MLLIDDYIFDGYLSLLGGRRGNIWEKPIGLFDFDDGLTDGLEFVLDPLVLLILGAQISSVRHGVVPNRRGHLKPPNVEVQQELSCYNSCFILSLGFGRTFHDPNCDFFDSFLALPLDKHGTSTITFLSRQLME